MRSVKTTHEISQTRRRPQERNAAIDSIRVLAIISVILVHVGVGMVFGPIAKFISHLRFAITFFLIVAGYQWGKKIRAGAPIGGAYAGLSSRILKIFAFWSLVYLIIPLIHQGGIGLPAHLFAARCIRRVPDPLFARAGFGPPRGSGATGLFYVILIGAQLHLWFLTALVFGATMTAALLKWARETWLVWVVAAAYLFGFMSGLLIVLFSRLFLFRQREVCAVLLQRPLFLDLAGVSPPSAAP